MILTPEHIVELKSKINSSMYMLYDNDMSLIRRQANERSIAFRFGLYFTEVIRDSSCVEDPDLTIDFDYNRMKIVIFS